LELAELLEAMGDKQGEQMYRLGLLAGLKD
jgi:hypothetical protein